MKGGGVRGTQPSRLERKQPASVHVQGTHETINGSQVGSYYIATCTR